METKPAIRPERLAGDRDRAAGSWAREHGPAVLDLLLRLCGNRHDAEDLLQEAMLRAIQHRESFRAGSNARAWLMRIASNAFLDQCRRRRAMRLVPLEADAPSGDDPIAPLQAAEFNQALARAIAELPEAARVVFLLRTREELPFDQIAAAIGTSEQTARWHLMKARRQLMARLEGWL